MCHVSARHPEFAAALRSARKRAGKSQERIAAEVGTSRRHWIRWENGDHLPSPEFLERIGEATGKSFDEFAPADDDEEAASMSLTRDQRDMLAALAEALQPFRRDELAVQA